MTQGTGKGTRLALLAAGAAVVLWGVLGLADQGHWAYAGFRTDADFEIIRVDPGSPADRAGFSVGDRLLTSGGIPVTETRSIAPRPRPEIGSSRVYELDRDGETVTATVTFEQLPPRKAALWVAGGLVGFCFVGFGLWAFLGNPSSTTRLLAIISICLGLAFCEGPYFESFAVRSIVGTVVTTLVMLSFAALLHFMLEFPRRKAFLERPNALRILYLPALAMALYFVSLTLFLPDRTTALNRFTNFMASGFVIAYFGLSAATMISTFRRATPEERNELGLDFVLFGTLVGLVPLAITALFRVLAPSVILPGEDFYFLTLVLIPVSLALATRGWKAPTVA